MADHTVDKLAVNERSARSDTRAWKRRKRFAPLHRSYGAGALRACARKLTCTYSSVISLIRALSGVLQLLVISWLNIRARGRGGLARCTTLQYIS